MQKRSVSYNNWRRKMASSFNLHEGQSNHLPTFDSSGTHAEVGQRWKKGFRSFEYTAEGMGSSDTKRFEISFTTFRSPNNSRFI